MVRINNALHKIGGYSYIHTIYNTDIREDIGARHQRHEFDEVVTRKHFITRQDYRNACRKTRDFTNHRYANDAVSMDRIVQELQLESPSPIIAYKPQGVIKSEYPFITRKQLLFGINDCLPSTCVKKFYNSWMCRFDSQNNTIWL